MNSIDPKQAVSEILKQYPETLPVFQSFNMQCAENSEAASLSLEENILNDKVNLFDLLSALEKAINPRQTRTNSFTQSSKEIKVDTANNSFRIQIPPEIGEVTSREITIYDKFKWKEFLLPWGCLLGFVLFFLFVLMLYVEPLNAAIFAIIITGCLALYIFLSKRHIGVVGTNGFATYSISKRNNTVSPPEIYLFENFTGLLFSKTINLVNGVYTNTFFSFKLQNNTPVETWSLTGKHTNREEKPDSKSFGTKYPFLLDIETAWTNRLLQQLTLQMQTEGFVTFKTDSYTVTLGIDFIKSKENSFHRSEIKNIHFEDGFMFVEHLNYQEKYLGLKTSGDRMVIPINELPNKKAFLIMVENVLLKN